MTGLCCDAAFEKKNPAGYLEIHIRDFTLRNVRSDHVVTPYSNNSVWKKIHKNNCPRYPLN